MAATTSTASTEKKLDLGNHLRIGDEAPNFTADSTVGEVNWHKYIDGKWAILMSHPRDFTPVCTTEIGRVSQLKEQFDKRSTVLAVLSVDSVENHTKWSADIEDIIGTKVNVPLLGDADRKISLLYGMLDQTHLTDTGLPLTVRNVFIIGPDKKIKLIITYPAAVGRNFDEILRVLDSLQLAVSHKVATPADWTPGKECVVLPSVTTEEAQKIFPKGVKEVRKWLRTTPDPRSATQ